jgi:hypothetical protein
MIATVTRAAEFARRICAFADFLTLSTGDAASIDHQQRR